MTTKSRYDQQTIQDSEGASDQNSDAFFALLSTVEDRIEIFKGAYLYGYSSHVRLICLLHIPRLQQGVTLTPKYLCLDKRDRGRLTKGDTCWVRMLNTLISHRYKPPRAGTGGKYEHQRDPGQPRVSCERYRTPHRSILPQTFNTVSMQNEKHSCEPPPSVLHTWTPARTPGQLGGTVRSCCEQSRPPCAGLPWSALDHRPVAFSHLRPRTGGYAR